MKKLFVLSAIAFSVHVNSQTTVLRAFETESYTIPAGIVKSGSIFYTLSLKNLNSFTFLALDAGLNPINQRSWNKNAELIDLGEPGILNNEIIVPGGTQPLNGGSPFIIYLDTSGNITSSLAFNTFPFSNFYLKEIIIEGNQFSAYSCSDSLRQGFTRIDGTSANQLTQTNYFLSDEGRLKIYCSAIAGANEHLVAGEYSDTSAYGRDGMIAKINHHTVIWAKHYDFGTGQIERITEIIPAPEGAFIAVGHTEGTDRKTFMLKISSEGNVIWCRKTSPPFSWGRNLTGVVEMGNGDLIAAGNDETGTLGIYFFTRFSGEGIAIKSSYGYYFSYSYQSHHHLIEENGFVTSVGGRGISSVCRTNGDLANCEWYIDNSLDTALIVPVVSDFEISWFSVSPVSEPTIFTEVNVDSTIHDYCVTGFQDISTKEPVIYPNPSSEGFTVSFSDADITRTTVIDFTGRIIYSAPVYGTAVIPSLPKGIYILKCETDNKDWFQKIVSN